MKYVLCKVEIKAQCIFNKKNNVVRRDKPFDHIVFYNRNIMLLLSFSLQELF
jgi:hypothetical protein